MVKNELQLEPHLCILKYQYIFSLDISLEFSIKLSLPKSNYCYINHNNARCGGQAKIMLFLLDLVNNPMIDGMFVFHFFIRIFVVFCERANNFECTNIFSINFAEKTTFS